MSDEGGEGRAIVIDNGSGMVKAGYGGDEHPCSVFPSIIGRPRTQQIIGQSGAPEFFIGDEAN
jgi:actin-related protein